MSIEFLTSLAAVCGVCIAAVNVIVEVLKSFWLKKETSRPLAVAIVSIVIAYFVAYVYCEIKSVIFTPMIAIGTFFCGFFIAYGAMFGYDTLYGELFKSLEKLLKSNGN